MRRVVVRWLDAERFYTGIQVPRRFAKILYSASLNSHSIFHNIYPLLTDPGMLDLAYAQIKSKPGMMTKGISSVTLDGWSNVVSLELCQALKDESFRFSKSRKIDIPKPKGGTRPLKIAPPREKVIQKVLSNILQAIYEPAFSPFSYGFRPHIGQHDALEHIKKSYIGSRWFIEGDISKCFDEIDHKVLLGILGERIKDQKFLRLINKTLKAGYLDQNKVPHDCLVGTPQGSIVSPVLSNIILDKFDSFVEDVLMPKYNKGLIRKGNVVYKRLMARSTYFSKQYALKKVESIRLKAVALRKEAQLLPATEPSDSDFRRLK